jgi:protein-disulfide isomerase
LTPRLAVLAGLCATLAPAAASPPGQVVRVEHYDPSATPSRGPANALVTVELFFPPTVNGSRQQIFRLLEQLQQQHPTRMRVIYRIVKRNTQPPGPQLPTLALEAYAQGKFFEFIAAIQALRPGALTRDQMIEVGRKLGLDPGRLDRAITEDRYRDVLTANERRLDRLRGTSAPAVFFNDKAIRASVNNASEADLKTEYENAYERALDLIDRGVDPRGLAEAFDSQMLQSTQPTVAVPPPDDDLDSTSNGHRLANPPLDLTGLPSLGEPGGGGHVPVVILCRPNDSTNCRLQMSGIAAKLKDTYRSDVRIVWAPWFDLTNVSTDDATRMSMLGDAALCAEAVGSNPDDLDASPGWQWVTEVYAQLGRAQRRTMATDKLIDAVAQKLHIDTHQLSACRARIANTTLGWIAAARHAGVTRSPAMVIGGRIYESLQDQTLIQQLVEAELAPGVLGDIAPSWKATPR